MGNGPEQVRCDTPFGVVTDRRLFYFAGKHIGVPGIQRQVPLEHVLSVRLERRRFITEAGIYGLLLAALITVSWAAGRGFVVVPHGKLSLVLAGLAALALIWGIIHSLRPHPKVVLTFSPPTQPNLLANLIARVFPPETCVIAWGSPQEMTAAHCFVATLDHILHYDRPLAHLLQVAQAHQGQLTLATALAETGLAAPDLESLLTDLMRQGRVDVGNAPDTGVLVYTFVDLI
ncbi:MAG: hypothetical protein IGQ88_05170 [Gloeomargaritaceae cyanobacterium C42_A2020_066]|nr:hypothetical protein [Gloeomargaritaceae cyanobacterium C42_A2020_066]